MMFALGRKILFFSLFVVTTASCNSRPAPQSDRGSPSIPSIPPASSLSVTSQTAPTASLSGVPSPSTTSATTPSNSRGQIAYSAHAIGNASSEIMLMDLDTGNETRLTDGFIRRYSRPVWSPDGSQLAMIGERNAESGSGLAKMKLSLEEDLPKASPPSFLVRGGIESFTWSPDGKRIAFTLIDLMNPWKAYTVDLWGSKPTLIPGIPAHARDLAWSPDGAWIAFSYDTSSLQVGDLYVAHPDGSGLTRLTDTPDMHEIKPAWSPDSRMIAFSRQSKTIESGLGASDIYVMSADGSNPTRITGDPADELDPTWSPDGTQIAFVSTRPELGDGNTEIYLINADGTNEIRLTNNQTHDRWPSWRRTPEGTSFGECTPAGQFVTDLTIPSGTKFAAPKEFTKVWRIRNSGKCAWSPSGYELRLANGERMSGPDSFPISGAVQPGQTADVGIRLAAPEESGVHHGAWNIYDDRGRIVAGPDGQPLALSVDIDVLPAGSRVLPDALYFLSNLDGDSQIWRMDADGATLKQITTEDDPVRSFTVSPIDGSITFIIRNQLINIRRDGTGRRVITDFGEGYGGCAAWSRSGLLAYIAGGIRIYNSHTGADRMLKANGSGEWGPVYFPVLWSPNGSKLLVDIGYYEGGEMGILSTDDGTVLTMGPSAAMAVWRKDSQAVYLSSAAYIGYGGMEPGLSLMSLSGGVTSIIESAFIWWPFYRPDDQLAFFVSRPSGVDVQEYKAQLAVSNRDGTGEHVLRTFPFIFGPSDIFEVNWRADGSAAVVRLVRSNLGGSEILLVPANDDPPVFLMEEGSGLQWDTNQAN
jgi:Tol biopolymer transport system component